MFQSYFQDTPTKEEDENDATNRDSSSVPSALNNNNCTTIPQQPSVNNNNNKTTNNRQLLLDDDDGNIDHHDDLLNSGIHNNTTTRPHHGIQQQQQYQRSGGLLQYRSNRSSTSSSSSIPSPHHGAAVIPPFSVTGVISAQKFVAVPHRGTNIQLQYMIYRPRNLQPISASAAKNLPPHILASFQSNPPIVAVSGGPGMPCAYLAMPLVQSIQDRSIIVYDAYGCGKNITNNNNNHHHNFNTLSGTNNTTNNTLQQNPNHHPYFHLPDMVLDLKAIIESLPVQKYHLIGHSFGGIVAYEYLQLLKKEQQQQNHQKEQQSCLSFVMSSTPSSIPDVDRHCQTLLYDIKKELLSTVRTMNQKKKKNNTVTGKVNLNTNNSNVQEQQSVPVVITDAMNDQTIGDVKESSDQQNSTDQKSIINESIAQQIDLVARQSNDPEEQQVASNESTIQTENNNVKQQQQSEEDSARNDSNKATTEKNDEEETDENRRILQGMVQRAKERTEKRNQQQQQQQKDDSGTKNEVIGNSTSDDNIVTDQDGNQIEYDEDVIKILEQLDVDYDNNDDCGGDDEGDNNNNEIGLSTVRTIHSLAQKLYFERYECRVKPIPMALQHSIEGYRVTALGNYNATVSGADRNNENMKDLNTNNYMSFRQYDVRKRNDILASIDTTDNVLSTPTEEFSEINIHDKEGDANVDGTNNDPVETKVNPPVTSVETDTPTTIASTTPSLLESILDGSDSPDENDTYHVLDQITNSELDDARLTSTPSEHGTIRTDDNIDNNPRSETIPTSSSSVLPQAVLLLRGQYDFVPHENIAEWIRHFSSKKTITRLLTLSNCSHYSMIENEDLYGTVISTLLFENDNR